MKTKIPAVALLTDFGHRDAFVGTLKGVLLRTAPSVRWIDLLHDLPPQDIQTAAFHLMTSYSYFPKGTLFVVVVDPGVGTGRRCLYVESKNYRFLAPDNGVLSWTLHREKSVRAWSVENQSLFLRPLSSTFHGRDVFAPVAGALARGLAPQRLGPSVRSWKTWPFPMPKKSRGKIAGQVLAVDRFGNLITNIRPSDLPKGDAPWIFSVPKGAAAPWEKTYGSVPRGRALAVTGSAGYIELSVREGSAAARWKAGPGTRVTARAIHKKGFQAF